MSTEPKIFTLRQVLQSIKKTIEERYQSLYWVKVEMHKLNLSASGHCYPELLQKENGNVVAQIRSTIWKANFERINKRFVEIVKEPLKDDLTLLLQVKISFSEIYGLTLEIVDIDPSYSLGELQRERLETLRKLKELNLLNANQRLPFPLLPKRIAVIAAPGTKGLNDFYQVLDNNKYGYVIQRTLFPATVDGDKAIQSILGQLRAVHRALESFDLLVIVRGGGGEVGLSCYNNFELCQAISSFPLPVLTGIGHSTNLTVAEMIAYRNAITPTELAEFLVQTFREFDLRLDELFGRIAQHTESILVRHKNALERLGDLLESRSKEVLLNERHGLREIEQQLIHRSQRFLQKQLYKQEQTSAKLTQLSQHFVERQSDDLKGMEIALLGETNRYVQKKSQTLEQLANTVRLLDPIHVLRRGYSITTINGKLPKSDKEWKEGAILETRTSELILQSTLTSKTKINE
jgi:exodeoxyribonuclease VII large subunit